MQQPAVADDEVAGFDTDVHLAGLIQVKLEGVGLSSRAPPMAPARPHPQPEFDYAA